MSRLQGFRDEAKSTFKEALKVAFGLDPMYNAPLSQTFSQRNGESQTEVEGLKAEIVRLEARAERAEEDAQLLREQLLELEINYSECADELNKFLGHYYGY